MLVIKDLERNEDVLSRKIYSRNFNEIVSLEIGARCG